MTSSSNFNMAALVARSTLVLGVLFLLVNQGLARIHQTLNLPNEDRSQIDLSKFGFLKGGSLKVNLTTLIIPDDLPKKDNYFGFSLDMSISDGISSYLEKHTEECMLTKAWSKEDKRGVNMVLFMFNLQNNTVTIERQGPALQQLAIYGKDSNQARLARTVRKVVDPEDVNKTVEGSPNEPALSADNTAAKPATQKPATPKTATPKPATQKPTTHPPTPKAHTSPKQSEKADPPEKEIEKVPVEPPAAETKLTTSLKMENLNDKKYSLVFYVDINREVEEGLYNLYFHNCHNLHGEDVLITLSVAIEEVNANGNYLSAGEIPLPTLYFTMSVVFFFTAWLWVYVLKKYREDVFKIHYLMLGLIFLKSLSLLFHAIDYHFIAKDGFPMESWAVMYYITHLLKGSLLFITIVFIGAGWAFVKQILSDKDKKIFMIVIPLQVLSNVAYIIIEQTEEGKSQYSTWKEIFILVDLLCCGAILFPVVWSIRHLQEASSTDGKAAISLAKLKLFRHFYIMVVCYIYFTRIIVYLLKITVPFQYIWLNDFFTEVATYLFFVVTAYKFRPASNNPYLQVPLEEPEIEMDEVLTETGATDGLKKVNTNAAKQRESNHYA